MSTNGDQAPEIPGFQPLHIRGAGRLGIWIEARQVRLDRRVLLKVLPAADQGLQDEFLREVQALVLLDGEGALRVIDEGVAGRARYVALDEGEASLLSASALETQEKLQFLRDLLDLYEKLFHLGIAAGPIPANAIRRLPSGGFVVAELGAVPATTDEVEICQRAALSFESLGTAYRLGAVSVAVAQALRNRDQSFSSAREILDRQLKPKENARPSRWLMAAAILIVFGGFFFPRWWRDSQQESGDNDPAVVVSSIGEDSIQEAPELQNQPLENSNRVGNRAEDSIGPIEQFARIRIQQQVMIQHDSSSLKTWLPMRDQVLQSLADGDLSTARQYVIKIAAGVEGEEQGTVNQEQGTVSQEQGTVNPEQGTVSQEKQALLQAWRWIEDRQLAQARARESLLVARDEYDAAADVLDEMAKDLGLEDRFASESTQLRERGISYRQVSAEMEILLEEAFVSLPDLSISMPVVPPELSSFKRLQQRWSVFTDGFGEVRSAAQRVVTAVEKRISDEEVLSWCMSEGEPFEARAIAVDEWMVSLRQVGRRQPRTHSWDQISTETLLQLIRESGLEVGQEADWKAKLQTVWGGTDRILEVARSTSLINQEVRLAAQRLRMKQIEIWVAEGERASRDGDVGIQRRVATDIALWITDQERFVFEDRLIEWWSALVEHSGPVALGLFPEAQISGWDPRFRSLQLEWQADAQGLPDWKSRAGSSISGRGELARVQGRIYLDSPLRFVDRLEVRVVGLVTREDAPNFNVVLWDGSPEALIFGAGIRPPELSSIRVGEEDVLLPAHVIVEEKMLAKGGGHMPMPSPRPRVVPGKPVRLVVREDEAGSSLRFDGTMVMEAKARPVALLGGVALETFGVPVVVREVVVRGHIGLQDWSRLLRESARSALWEIK